MSEAINILPFERLLGMLRAHGFYTGVDTLMRLSKYWQVLIKREDWDIPKVKFQLAALLCKNADDQKKLYEILDTYLPDLLLEAAPPSPAPSVPEPTIKPTAPSIERPWAEPVPPPEITPPPYIPTGLTGPILPRLEFPEEPMRPWNLPGMGPALIPLQEKVWTETAEWDVPATIRRTIHAGGIPQFCFKRRKRAPRYLALIEQLNPRDHLAGFSAELMREINRRDLEVDFYFYEKTPARCWKNVRNLRSHVHLDYLKSEWEGARLLLIGSTTPYINQATGQPSNLALDLPDSWDEVALLNTASPLEWGAAEQTLMELFPVVPLTIDGLFSLMAQWNATGFRSPVYWQTAEPQPIPPTLTPTSDRNRDDVVLDMYRYLGKDAFRWACATAVYPEIYFEMTAILHDEAIPPKSDFSEWEQNQAWHSALLLLCRLEWYRRGYIPEPMRDDLRKRLSNTDLGTVEQEVRRILEWSNNAVLSGSYAADERQEMFGWLAERLFRVLWIDDHPENNTRFQAAWTKELGIVFRNATSMSEALTWLAEPFDLIISDIGRKGEASPGFTTLQELRSRNIEAPVVFFTNTRGMNLRSSLISDGALEVTNMVAVLKNLLEERIRLKFAPPETTYSQGGSGSMSFESSQTEQTPNIPEGPSNEENARYQSILKELGYLKVEVVDGIFGPEMREAVRSFQKDQGLIADGVLGPQTKAALEKAQAEQPKNLTGRVFDAQTGRSLDGVYVQLLGANQLEETDKEGRFSVPLPTGDAEFEFTYPGYETQRVAYRGQPSFSVALQPAESEQPEIPGFWQRLATGVCRIMLADETQGTGFLTEGGYIFTANFVLPNRDQAREASAIFRTDDGALRTFGLDEKDFVTQEGASGFSRVRLKGYSEERFAGFAKLPFYPELPGTGAKVSLIYFGPSLRAPVFRLDCPLTSFSEKELTYEAETENGSGGAPVFMPDGRVVGIHLAGTDKEGFKRGISMKAVLSMLDQQPTKEKTKTIFISYAHPDEKMFWDFEKQLEALKAKHEITIQSRRDLEMMKAPPPVQNFLERADLILLLVSPAYLSSEEILSSEVYPALELQESGGKTVVPVILQPCDWEKAPFAYLQALPSGGRPVSDFSREERGWSEVVSELERIIERLGRDDEPPREKRAFK